MAFFPFQWPIKTISTGKKLLFKVTSEIYCSIVHLYWFLSAYSKLAR